jgi:ABC-2 type transport system ATP-binding protein
LAKTFHKPVLDTDWLTASRLLFRGQTSRAAGLIGAKVDAVKDIRFEVSKGDIFGLIGPNGAGKTTTIKMLTGLIRATHGSASIFGIPIPSPAAMARVGFLPENPYIYPYLTPREFVTLCARLSGVRGPKLGERVERIIERTGIAEAIDRPSRALSKGMLQRAGLAAALVHEPELLILDEPMSGLDPVGRKEVRDLILEEKRAGRTIVFSTHILADVELLCDRVCILRKGEVVVSGVLRKLLDSGAKRSELHLSGASEALLGELLELGGTVRVIGHGVAVEIEGEEKVRAALTRALESGATVESVVPKRETLEELFVRRAL